MLQFKLLDNMTVEYIKRGTSICNRGIHGEIVDDEYINYVKQVLPQIVKRLNIALKKAENYSFCVCTRCGFKGYTSYSNECPLFSTLRKSELR